MGGEPLDRSGRLQWYLQHRPWPWWRLGNALSTVRYVLWRVWWKRRAEAQARRESRGEAYGG